jgi:hypothetical protein
MAEPLQQKPEEDIIIRTMRSDLEKLGGVLVKKEEKPVSLIPPKPISPISKEAVFESPKTPSPMPAAPLPSALPILMVPPKIIPPKKFPEISVKPLFKPTPVWIKIGAIGFGIVLLIFSGIYGYWKIFVKNQPVTPPVTTPVVIPTLPTAPATSTMPIKFFNKLPHKAITIDLSAKTSAALLKALKSEAAISETLASIKQIKITYQGKPITTEEFFNLILIFSPKDFLANCESEFALAFFIQKEGARPVLILKIKNLDLAQTQMTDWEKKTLTSDILPIFLTDFKLPKILPAFKSYLFINQLVRYLNINMPFASLNYAIYNNYLIFTTSSAGMFVVLQDLTGQNVSLEYLKNLEASINKFMK